MRDMTNSFRIYIQFIFLSVQPFKGRQWARWGQRQNCFSRRNLAHLSGLIRRIAVSKRYQYYKLCVNRIVKCPKSLTRNYDDEKLELHQIAISLFLHRGSGPTLELHLLFQGSN